MEAVAEQVEQLSPEKKSFRYFKEQHPGAVIFFLMGDSYEAYYEDARVCADVLKVTLFNRNENSGNPIPLVRVPSHAIKGCLEAMLQAGYTVAANETYATC